MHQVDRIFTQYDLRDSFYWTYIHKPDSVYERDPGNVDFHDRLLYDMLGRTQWNRNNIYQVKTQDTKLNKVYHVSWQPFDGYVHACIEFRQ